MTSDENTTGTKPPKLQQTLTTLTEQGISLMERIPQWTIAILARFSIAAVFWKSGQTKIQGFAIDIIEGRFDIGWPALSDSAIFLFEEEYGLPFIPADIAAVLAAAAEHILPVLILVGLATRFASLGLFVMTLVIEIFVYPDAYPTHGVWAAVLLFLMAYGPGRYSLDHLVKGRFGSAS